MVVLSSRGSTVVVALNACLTAAFEDLCCDVYTLLHQKGLSLCKGSYQCGGYGWALKSLSHTNPNKEKNAWHLLFKKYTFIFSYQRSEHAVLFY